MSRLIFDKKDPLHDNDDDSIEWTTGRFIDEFFLDICKATNEIKLICDHGISGKAIHYRKYYRQAISKFFRIPLTEQDPKSEEEAVPFIIDFNDLSSRVQCEFLQYCRLYSDREVRILLKLIVISIFENLDWNYTHMSVMKKLRVKIIGL
jgi:hypothetical protein